MKEPSEEDVPQYKDLAQRAVAGARREREDVADPVNGAARASARQCSLPTIGANVVDRKPQVKPHSYKARVDEAAISAAISLHHNPTGPRRRG
jgi:hypothetical protein